MDRQQRLRTELFIFPDGMSVELFVFDDERAAIRHPAYGTASPEPDCLPCPQLALTCTRCGSALVYPVDWQRNSAGRWDIRTRCPDCNHEHTAIMARADVERLNRSLYLGKPCLAGGAPEQRRCFEEEAAWFVDALARDLILPMDF